MARPKKQGIDYFPVDVVMDDKVALIEAAHGLVGFGILIKLYQKIYSEGYFYKWGEEQQLLFSKWVSVDRNVVIDTVNDCIKWGLFHQELYETQGILTSKGIQERYLVATYKRSGIEMDAKYLLLDVSDRKNVTITGVSDIQNSDTTEVSDGESTQSKVKESKVKYIKKKYKEFVSMTTEEYQKLIDEFGKKLTKDMIEDLNNYKGSTGKKYKNDYLTIRAWIRKDQKKVKSEGAKDTPKNQLGIDFGKFREN